MGSIVKGVGSLFGGRARRREQKSANQEFAGSKQAAAAHQFGVDLGPAQTAASQGYQATQQQVGQLGQAAQAQVAQLGDAQGYDAQGYDAQGLSLIHI